MRRLHPRDAATTAGRSYFHATRGCREWLARHRAREQGAHVWQAARRGRWMSGRGSAPAPAAWRDRLTLVVRRMSHAAPRVTLGRAPLLERVNGWPSSEFLCTGPPLRWPARRCGDACQTRRMGQSNSRRRLERRQKTLWALTEWSWAAHRPPSQANAPPAGSEPAEQVLRFWWGGWSLDRVFTSTLRCA